MLTDMWADGLAGKILAIMIVFLLLVAVVLVWGIIADIYGYYTRGSVQSGIVVDKWFEEAQYHGVIGKGGYYAPATWYIRVYGTTTKGYKELADFSVEKSAYNAIKISDNWP